MDSEKLGSLLLSNYSRRDSLGVDVADEMCRLTEAIPDYGF